MSLAVLESSQLSPEKVDFYSLSREDLAVYLKDALNWPTYRSTQLFNWVYKTGQTDFSLMTNIANKDRELLGLLFSFPKAEIANRQISKDGTRKYLFKVSPDVTVESVMIKQPKRMTLCVSSQVGCGMGCKFCQTATMGFQKNLTSGDIVRQVLGVNEDAKNFNDSFSNIVFMGMGEPLHNIDNVARAVLTLKDDQGLGLAPRKITISTVGLVPAIKKFAKMDLGVSLAVSLNATTDEVRSMIMPINQRFNIEQLISALKEVPLKGRKQITIEYVMLSGVNDTKEDLKRLPSLIKDLKAKINLIPYNDNAGLGFKTPERSWVYHWQEELNKKYLNTTIRWSKGKDIDAACGQLKVKFEQQ
jgi:23S rRNA (adenine2503-C2)-methyltransferase